MTAGDIYAIAGDGTAGRGGDGGAATAAELDHPYAVTVDGAGNVVIADTGSNQIRVVAATTGTYYGQAMTAGDIYTVAGLERPGFSGDGGPATAAALDQPRGVAVDGAGNLIVSDTLNHRVRVVAARSGTFYGQAMTAGDIYTVAGDGAGQNSGNHGPATAAGLGTVQAAVAGGGGNLYIGGGSQLRMVTG
jgi:hypothetical protein